MRRYKKRTEVYQRSQICYQIKLPSSQF